MLQLTKRVINFILQILEDGFITKKKCHMGTLSYYSIVWYLRDNKIINANVIDGNNQKKWKFTSLGKEVALHLKAIKDLTEAKNV